MGKRQNCNSNAQMRSESPSNAKSSQDFAPQGFAASTASNLSSVTMNAAQQARNLASSVSSRITLPASSLYVLIKITRKNHKLYFIEWDPLSMFTYVHHLCMYNHHHH
jgi:hypothetical protein